MYHENEKSISHIFNKLSLVNVYASSNKFGSKK